MPVFAQSAPVKLGIIQKFSANIRASNNRESAARLEYISIGSTASAEKFRWRCNEVVKGSDINGPVSANAGFSPKQNDTSQVSFHWERSSKTGVEAQVEVTLRCVGEFMANSLDESFLSSRVISVTQLCSRHLDAEIFVRESLECRETHSYIGKDPDDESLRVLQSLQSIKLTAEIDPLSQREESLFNNCQKDDSSRRVLWVHAQPNPKAVKGGNLKPLELSINGSSPIRLSAKGASAEGAVIWCGPKGTTGRDSVRVTGVNQNLVFDKTFSTTMVQEKSPDGLQEYISGPVPLPYDIELTWMKPGADSGNSQDSGRH